MAREYAPGSSTRVALHPRRTERRSKATQRAVERDKRSTAEQLALIAQRPGQSIREVARLTRADRPEDPNQGEE